MWKFISVFTNVFLSIQILNGSKNSAGKSKIHVCTNDFVNYYIDRWCASTVKYYWLLGIQSKIDYFLVTHYEVLWGETVMETYDRTWPQLLPRLLQSKDIHRQNPHCSIFFHLAGKLNDFAFELPIIHHWKMNLDALPVSVSDRSEVRLAGWGFRRRSSSTLASDRASEWFRWASFHLQWPRTLQKSSKNHVLLYSTIPKTHTFTFPNLISTVDEMFIYGRKKTQYFFR